MSGDLDNMILGVIERWWASRYSERHGLVTSYDPKKYLAKVTFQPEGQESGWLPIETGHIGEGYGVTIGLQPGKGGSKAGMQNSQGAADSQSSQNQGDQVVVRFQEGDFEGGKIVQRVHSEQDTPPETQSGEIIIWTKFQKSGGQTPDSADGGQGGQGQQIALKKDGSLSVTDGNGATIQLDGNGNIVFTCKKFTVNASGDIKLISTANALLKGASAILYATANAFIKAAGGNINAKASGALKADPLPWVPGANDPPTSG
jgi:phage baseplate assembly protein gpV